MHFRYKYFVYIDLLVWTYDNIQAVCLLETHKDQFFVLIQQQKHCTPAALEMYYTEQQEEQDPGVRGGVNAGLYAALSRLNQVKRTGPELPSPWLPVVSAPKEAEAAKQSSEQLRGALEREE